jgi:hypothetical protein
MTVYRNGSLITMVGEWSDKMTRLRKAKELAVFGLIRRTIQAYRSPPLAASMAAIQKQDGL